MQIFVDANGLNKRLCRWYVKCTSDLFRSLARCVTRRRGCEISRTGFFFEIITTHDMCALRTETVALSARRVYNNVSRLYYCILKEHTQYDRYYLVIQLFHRYLRVLILWRHYFMDFVPRYVTVFLYLQFLSDPSSQVITDFIVLSIVIGDFSSFFVVLFHFLCAFTSLTEILPCYWKIPGARLFRIPRRRRL